MMSLLLALCDIADAQSLEKTRLGISDLSFTFSPHLIAKDAEIFQKHGLQVELIFIGGPVGGAALAQSHFEPPFCWFFLSALSSIRSRAYGGESRTLLCRPRSRHRHVNAKEKEETSL
jgi:hypothetical protein